MSIESNTAKDDASAPSQEDADAFKNAVALGNEAIELGSSFVRLVAMEVVQAVKNIPKVFGLVLFSVFLIGTAWISFSALSAYGAYALWQSTFAAFLSFFILQVAALIGCKLLISRLLNQASLPMTREIVQRMREP